MSSTPVDGSRVEASPAQVVLTFDEAVQLVPGAATVLDDSGTTVSVPPAHLAKSGKSVVIPLKPHLPRGSYTATWRIVSADTHVVSGSITFGVRQDAVTAPTSSATAVGSLEVVSGIGKGATYLGAALLFGVLAAGGLFWPDTLRSRRMRWTRRIGWVALTGGTLAELLLQGPQAVQSGWSGVARLDDMPQTLDTTYGVALVVRLAALIAVAASGPWARMHVDSAATSRRPVAGAPVRAGATGLAATTVLVTITLGGHAAVGADRSVAILVTTVHLAAMALWIGGSAVLLIGVLPRRDAADGNRIRSLRHWSLSAYVCIVVLVLSGEFQAWRELHPVASLWHTAYGLTLVVKLGLVAVILPAALLAQRAVISRATQNPSGALRTVRRSVRIESAVAVAVLAATTVLVSQPPARDTYGPATTITAPLGADRMIVEIDSTRRGPQHFTLTAVDGEGRPVRLQDLSGSLSSTGIASLDLRLERGPGLSWHSVDAVVPRPGTWTIHLDASIGPASGWATVADYTTW